MVLPAARRRHGCHLSHGGGDEGEADEDCYVSVDEAGWTAVAETESYGSEESFPGTHENE